MEALAIWKWVVIVWFAVSASILIVENIAFYIHLIRAGARPSFMWSATPTYLNKVYRRWLRENELPEDKKRLYLRRALLINALLSAAVFWFVATTSFGGGVER
jgi:hypothetical protein